MASKFSSQLSLKLRNLGLAKYGWLTDIDIDWPPEKLTNEYIEAAIYGLFKLDIINYVKMKAVLAKQFHIQPSEIDILPAWEYELFIKQLNDIVKEENDKQKSEMKKYRVNEYMNMARPGNMNKMMSNSMPKMASPNINMRPPGGMSMPKF